MSASEEENLRIATEAAAALNAPGKINPPEASSTLSEDSGVTDENLGGFETTRGMSMVDSGRTGQSGGGGNPQNIPPEEGGDDDRPTSSTNFEGEGDGGDKTLLQAQQAPGSVNLSGNRTEAVPTVDSAGERERNLIPLDEVGTGSRMNPAAVKTDALGNDIVEE